MKRWTRPNRVQGALLCGALLCGAVFVEVWLRLIHYERYFPDATPPAYERVYDPWRGYALKPHQRIDWLSKCFSVKGIETNQFGMRDVERQIAKTGTRVALLGDSFLRGFEVGNDEVINRHLERAFPGVEFLNFGESGYGTIQAYQTYVHLASRFKPDLVIYFMATNDLIDNHYLLRAWRGGHLGNVAPGFDNLPDLLPGPDGAWTFVKPANLIENPQLLARGKRWLARHLRLYLLVRRACADPVYQFQRWKIALAHRAHTWWSGLTRWVRQLIQEAAADPSPSSDGGDSPPAPQAPVYIPAAENMPAWSARWGLLLSFLTSAPPRNRVWKEAWEVTRHTLVLFADAVWQDGATFAVVGIPEKLILDLKAYHFDIEAYNAERGNMQQPPEGFDPAYFYAQIGSFLSENGIPFLNLQEAYESWRDGAVGDPLALYHVCNIHWNEAGHRVSAAIVGDFIRPWMRPTVE